MTAPSETKPDKEPTTTTRASRAKSPATPAAKKNRPEKVSEKVLRDGIVKMYSGLGLLMALPNVAMPTTAEAIVDNAEDVADAWMTAAKANEKVWFALQRMMTGGAMGAVFFAHLPILGVAFMEVQSKRTPAVVYINDQGQPVDGQGNPVV